MENKKEKISLDIIRDIEGDRVFAMAHKILELYEDMIGEGKRDTIRHWNGNKLEIENGKIKRVEYTFPEWDQE